MRKSTVISALLVSLVSVTASAAPPEERIEERIEKRIEKKIEKKKKPERKATAKTSDGKISKSVSTTLNTGAGRHKAAEGSKAKLISAKDSLTSLRDFEKKAFVDPSKPRKIYPPNTVAAKQNKGNSSSAPSTQPAWTLKLKLPDLPVRFNDRLLRYLDYYKNSLRGRALMRYWLKRKGRYESLIENAISKHPVPKALIYVAMIESSYRPDLTSRVGAAGIWQFMVRTGRGYGLKYDYWIDQRRDPEKSTNAAMRYLMALKKRVGSWELVLAAYNAGLGSVLNAIRKYNTNDYWRLCRYEAGLPWSTTLYVAKVNAVALVDLNRKFFGFEDIKPVPELKWELAKVTRSTTLKQAAKASGATLEEIRRLNPDLRRGRTPPKTESWIRLPIGLANNFYGNLATRAHRPEPYAAYEVRLGDSLKVIAKEYRLSQRRLKKLNGLRHPRELRPGLTILVPKQRKKKKPAPKKVSKTKTPAMGELLLVPVAPQAPTRIANRERIFYRVVVGDSLAEICNYLGVRRSELLKWNALDETAKPVKGMILQAFVANPVDPKKVRLVDAQTLLPIRAGSSKFLNTFEKRRGRNRLIYAVRDGDSLRSISKRFGLSVGSLMRINKFGRSTVLQPGAEIVIYASKPKETARQKRKRLRLKQKRKRRKKQRISATSRPPSKSTKKTTRKKKALSPDKKAKKAKKAKMKARRKTKR